MDNAEIARLQAENAALKSTLERQAQVARRTGGIFAILLFGPGLVLALRRWFEVAAPNNPVPPDETARLVAAILRRMTMAGLLAVAIPTLLMVWQNNLLGEQNNLIRLQNQYFRDQTREMQRQIDQQQEQYDLSRRSELLAIIYDANGAPASHAYALLALADIERRAAGKRKTPFRLNIRGANLKAAPLSGVDLSALDLAQVDLSGAELLSARLHGAQLRGARFDGARLENADLAKVVAPGATFLQAQATKANFGGSDLASANFTGANLASADLTGARLLHANFHDAKLDRTLISGTDLRLAQGLVQEQINAACGDNATQLPAGLERPVSWPCH